MRPLFDDGKGNPSAVTRDYVFDLDETGGAPLLNVFGGKITTFRELAERGMQRLAKFFPNMGGDWTGLAPSCPAARSGTRTSSSSPRSCGRLSLDAARPALSLCPHLRRPHRAGGRRRDLGRGARPPLRRPALRGRGALPGGQRVGADPGGRAAPAHQAGAAHERRRSAPPSPPGSRRSLRRPPEARAGPQNPASTGVADAPDPLAQHQPAGEPVRRSRRPDRHRRARPEDPRPPAHPRVHQPELAGAGDPAAHPADGRGARGAPACG